MPEDYSCTDYVFYSKATYQDKTASSADIFTIICSESWLTGITKTGAAWGFAGGMGSALSLFLIIICLLIVILFTAKNYEKMQTFVKSKFDKIKENKQKKEIPEQKPKIPTIQTFKQLLQTIELNLKNHDFKQAKNNYAKITDIYADLNQQPISGEKKMKMYNLLKKEYKKLKAEYQKTIKKR